MTDRRGGRHCRYHTGARMMSPRRIGLLLASALVPASCGTAVEAPGGARDDDASTSQGEASADAASSGTTDLDGGSHRDASNGSTTTL